MKQASFVVIPETRKVWSRSSRRHNRMRTGFYRGDHNGHAPVAESRLSIVPLDGTPSSPPLQESAGVYEAVVPPAETLVGMAVIVVLCVACAWYWNEKVVPVSRTNLAISKSRGDVKKYLDALAIDTKDYNSTAIDKDKNEEFKEDDRVTTRSTDRAFERWLFTDWLVDNKYERKVGRQKDPAIPILRDAKWNSGDNPVVVAALLMLIGLTLTSITERISTALLHEI